MILTTLAIGVVHYQAERTQLLDIGESNHVALTQTLANALLPRFRSVAELARSLDTETLKIHPEVSTLRVAVFEAMKNSRIVKLKLYDAGGRTIFSTDPAQIGINYAANPGFISAIQGKPLSELTHRHHFSGFDREMENVDVLSSYVSLRSGTDQPVEGVLEVYSDITDWVARTDQQALVVTVGTVAALCMLYAVLYFIVLRADRIIRSQYDELQRSESELRIAATVLESQEGMLVTDADAKILRGNQAFTSITGYAAEEVIGKKPTVLSSGRHDPDFYAEMWAAIRHDGTWQGEIWDRRKDGSLYPAWLTITAVKDSNGKITNYVGTMVDITLRKAAEDEARNLAFYDSLTRLPNRRLLFDRLEQALATSARVERGGALLFVDLDKFKAVNDTFGHNVGDLLLQEVATRLRACIRESDTVARLGGDEFVVMLENLDPDPTEAAAQVRTVGEKILSALNATYTLEGHECLATPSIGITRFHGRQHTAKELMHRADFAMYQAKQAGRNTLRYFDVENVEANHP
jgi:diguanylate cyclase (GGDEF)-like protein/PAS domain S-box-containing protein